MRLNRLQVIVADDSYHDRKPLGVLLRVNRPWRVFMAILLVLSRLAFEELFPVCVQTKNSKVVGAMVSRQTCSLSTIFSRDNMVRSLKVYYNEGLMSSQKYISLSTPSLAHSGSLAVPRLTQYKNVLDFLKSEAASCITTTPFENI